MRSQLAQDPDPPEANLMKVASIGECMVAPRQGKSDRGKTRP